jgi:hypothetical protein
MVTGALLAVGGVASLGVGAYYAVQTQLLARKISDAKTFNPNDYQAGKRAEERQWIFGTIGVGATVVGTVLHAIGSWQHDRSQGQVSFVPALGPGRAMISATGAF